MAVFKVYESSLTQRWRRQQPQPVHSTSLVVVVAPVQQRHRHRTIRASMSVNCPRRPRPLHPLSPQHQPIRQRLCKTTGTMHRCCQAVVHHIRTEVWPVLEKQHFERIPVPVQVVVAAAAAAVG